MEDKKGKRMKKAAMAALIAFVMASTMLIAQTPPNPANMVAHRVDYLTTVLNLTSSQQQQATTIFTNAANSESPIRSGLKTARQSLKTAETSNDTAGIEQAAATIGNLTGQLMSIQSKARAAFYQLLTSDQQAKLTKLEAQHGPGGHPGPPPGGFGGPGPTN